MDVLDLLERDTEDHLVDGLALQDSLEIVQRADDLDILVNPLADLLLLVGRLEAAAYPESACPAPVHLLDEVERALPRADHQNRSGVVVLDPALGEQFVESPLECAKANQIVEREDAKQ